MNLLQDAKLNMLDVVRLESTRMLISDMAKNWDGRGDRGEGDEAAFV